MALHEFLGETLAGFQLRRRFCGTENTPAAPGEFIHHAKLQRQLRTNHGQIRLDPLRQRQQRLDTS